MCRAFEQTREEGRIEGRMEGRMEGRIEGRMEGRIEGRMEGRIEGRELERLENLKSIIEMSSVSEKEAMDLLRIPVEEREKLSARLKS